MHIWVVRAYVTYDMLRHELHLQAFEGINENVNVLLIASMIHDYVIKWKHFPRYWPFVRGIHRDNGEFPAQRPVTLSFDVFFDLRLNKRLSKQSQGWWFETLSRPLWRHRNANTMHFCTHLSCEHADIRSRYAHMDK